MGYGPVGSDPSSSPDWTWTPAIPNPAWDGNAWGEPDNDEYMADLILPAVTGDYDYCFRFSGDVGVTWLYGDLATGAPGEDGSENGYQSDNAGKMTVLDVCCSAPDNGTGTVDFPADCDYDHPAEPMRIVEGLPIGSTLELVGPLTDFINVLNMPGGDLGGEICTFDATLDWTVTGTGDLAGLSRHLWVPVSGEIHTGPRNPGDPVQSFAAKIVNLSGELFGDPDFCTLRFRCGSSQGLPCAGQTTLTELPSGDFAVDSFFDITYEIEFEGCPDSQLADMSGTTGNTVPRTTCDDFYSVDWCRLQWPPTIEDYEGTDVTVYGRFYIAGLTDLSSGNDPAPGRVRLQVGYFGPGSDPFEAPPAAWTDGVPNPGWDAVAAGEPNNDEYLVTLTLPTGAGDYDYCVRVSGDAGSTWLYGDLDTGQAGEDGSENGYQSENAGKMVVIELCCSAPDNGTGTVDFPPACDYDRPSMPMRIVQGLPPETTIELVGPITDFISVVNVPGGDLGGEICTFDATLDWTATGTGAMAGFSRHLSVPISGEIHIGPRNPGDPIQSFPAKVVNLSGELFGDPDFCTLRFRCGSSQGLPSAGQTTLTELPSGDFAVDSFFDIMYEVEFEGCPDSQLADMSGTTSDTVPRTTCDDFYDIDWCRLQYPPTIQEYSGTDVTVYGRVYIEGLTDQSTGNDPSPGTVQGQVGFFGPGSDPFDAPPAVWTDAIPNPGWDAVAAGEPDNDEYMATLTVPTPDGYYDYCFRFSGDAGATWLYGDLDTGVAGEDGSENGYQFENAGKMTAVKVCCPSPDNGTGTIDMPPSCDYANPGDPMMIADGLPPDATIELAGPLTDIIRLGTIPGGTLGGEIHAFDATLEWVATGTGAMAGFSRFLSMPVTGEIHTGPRNPGDPVQTFGADLFRLDGVLYGDPDFCALAIRAGTDYGLPCPGSTTLTQLPSGDFAVDSFFDITYQIDFEGCPGSPLDEMMGTTTHTVWRSTCWNPTDVADVARPEVVSRLTLMPNTPNPFSVVTSIHYALPSRMADGPVTLKIYNVSGRLVRTLVDASQAEGPYNVTWDGRDRHGRPVAAGIYFCRLSAAGEAVTQRMVLLR